MGQEIEHGNLSFAIRLFSAPFGSRQGRRGMIHRNAQKLTGPFQLYKK
jgi:hypothetical protein